MVPTYMRSRNSRRIRPEYLELAERRAIEHSGARAHRARLALRRRLEGLARQRIRRRPVPIAKLLEQGAALSVPALVGQTTSAADTSAPARRPASSPKVTGANGGRNLVVPTSAGSRPVYSPIKTSALTLLVLP